MRLLEEIRAAGYTGGYSQLKAFVRQVRPGAAAGAGRALRDARRPPGAGRLRPSSASPWGIRYALLVVLGYSRLLWCRFYPRQDMRTLVSGLEEAFLAFGGVPQELLFDQMKAVITRDLRLEGGALVRNRGVPALRAPLGLHAARLSARIAPRRRARSSARCATSGAISSTAATSSMTPISTSRARHWLERVANVRVHATTQERPRVRFDRDERLLLQPLAPRRYTSLVLDSAVTGGAAAARRGPSSTSRSGPLTVYAQLAGGVA